MYINKRNYVKFCAYFAARDADDEKSRKLMEKKTHTHSPNTPTRAEKKHDTHTHTHNNRPLSTRKHVIITVNVLKFRLIRLT